MSGTGLMSIANTETRPFYVSHSFTQTTSGGTITIDTPAGTLTGDLMFAVMQKEGASQHADNTYTTASGWTETLDSAGLSMSWKVAVVSEAASHTFTSTITSAMSGYIFTLRNASYGSVAFPGVITGTGTTAQITGLNNAFALLIAEQQYYPDTTWSISSDSAWQSIVTDTDITAPAWAVWQKNIVGATTGSTSITNGPTSRTYRVATVSFNYA